MQRQSTTLFGAALLCIGLLLWGSRLAVPYVRDVPGPVSDALSSAGGKPLITIGKSTAAPKGKLLLLTVSEFGGPRQNTTSYNVLAGWWNQSDAIIPRDLLFSKKDTPQSVEQTGNTQMITSQEAAKIAALRYLGYQLTPGVDVAAVNVTALKKRLLVDDVIVGFDGTPVSTADQLHALTAKHKVGDRVVLQVRRGSAAVDVPTTMQPPPTGSTSPSIGISVVDSFVKPFTIGIDLAHVVGPSAGTGFALGIVDKLTDGNLTGGKTVAVTGTIDADGKVGAIGGVVQKMAGARRAGATLFLVPKDNCSEALTAIPNGLKVAPISTLSGAVAILKQFDAGDANLPTCTES
jgi:PDZ domain-containing protein